MEDDVLVTPLVYMTEVERSVAVAQVNRLEMSNLPTTGTKTTYLTKPLDEFTDSEFLTREDHDALDDAPSNQRRALRKAAVKRKKPVLEAAAQAQLTNLARVELASRMPTGVVGVDYPIRSVRGLRFMHRNYYGLVNVRTDGKTIMCASKRDSGERWTIHAFPAGPLDGGATG